MKYLYAKMASNLIFKYVGQSICKVPKHKMKQMFATISKYLWKKTEEQRSSNTLHLCSWMHFMVDLRPQ